MYLCRGAAMQKRKLRITPKFIVLLTVLCAAFACLLYFAQEKKLNEIAAQEAALQQQYQALQNEAQRLDDRICQERGISHPICPRKARLCPAGRY